MICDLRVKSKVSQTNVFQETKNHESQLFHELEFIQKFLCHHEILRKKWINNTPVYGLLRNKNQIFLVHQNGSTLDSLQREELQLLQIPAAFITPFFHESLLKS